MTFDQIAIVALLAGMFVAYALDRFRIELVALSGLAIAFAVGLVPLTAVFGGFSNPAVVTVVEILLVVSVLARTRAVDGLASLILARVSNERLVLALLCVAAAAISVVMNNIGALALMFPVTLSVCARLGLHPARMLMPLSFATLLGGMCSLTGTPANLIVNDWRIAETGGGFGYFALGSVGGPVAVIGLVWLIVAAPSLFRRTPSLPTPDDIRSGGLLVELHVAAASKLIGLSPMAIASAYEVHVHDVVRGGAHVFARRDAVAVAAGDVLLAEADLAIFDRLVETGAVVLHGANDERLEAVVTPESYLIGSRLGDLTTLIERGVTVIGLASRRRRIEGMFGDLQIGLGDVLLLAGERQALREAVAEAGLLALMPRAATAARPDAFRSVAIFAVGVAGTAIDIASPEIAFGAVVLAMALTGSLRLREALQDVNWTIVILLACMIPLGAAVQDTGAARVVADAIVGHLPTTQPLAVAIIIFVLATLITPFIDNVSVAAVLSPVAAGVATRAGMPIEPLLIAVAIGASLDFLTPFGHHNNAVVMGAAGYRFTDFPRLGLPLVGIGLVTASISLWLFWL
ncbi:cation transporter [Sphingomonas koreensis]|nr:cation transporter [Sphingomonas koreensis]